MTEDYYERIQAILEEDSRYHPDAYAFVQEAVGYTQEKLQRGQGPDRHVSGQELIEGMRDLALAQFGPMAMLVLQEWGIHTTEDFGHVVFSLIRHRLLGASESDTLEDFRDGYTFEDAFVKTFQPAGADVQIDVIC